MKNAHFVCVFLCPNTRRTPLNTAPPPAPPVSPTAEPTLRKSPIATLLFPTQVYYSLWGHRSALAARYRPLVMPLRFWGGKANRMPQNLALYVCARHSGGRRRCGSNSVFEKVSQLTCNTPYLPTFKKPHERDEMRGRRAFVWSARTKAYVNDKKSDLTKQVALFVWFF